MIRMVNMLLLSCLMFQIGFAQSVTEDSLEIMLNKAKDYYYRGEYESAIRELENALKYLKQLKLADQVEAYKYLAFSYVAFGDRTAAKMQFKKALALDPQMELDAATVSPKIIKVFEEAKGEISAAPLVEPSEPTVPARTEEISGFDATIRSCCVAGWGQMYRGEKSKGTKLMIAYGVTLVSTLGSSIIRENKRNEYLDLYWTQPSATFDDAYEEYKFWHNVTIVNALLFLGVHVYNLYDIIFKKPSVRTSLLKSERGFICAFDKEQVRIGYNLNF
ncbi:MAG: tetratricopeptide repeat protein [candidate division WOR-3 bacterium]|nr:MAG: tetratricopeptide repeat protein [candidate division WOR-3 bacterium]